MWGLSDRTTLWPLRGCQLRQGFHRTVVPITCLSDFSPLKRRPGCNYAAAQDALVLERSLQYEPCSSPSVLPFERAAQCPSTDQSSMLNSSGSVSSQRPPANLNSTDRVVGDLNNAQALIRKRGRKKGKPAWNKGLKTKEETRRRISDTQKLRWQQNPQLRSFTSAKLKGMVAWNKGQQLGEATRQKMSESKRGHRVSLATRKKMSKAHTGILHKEETKLLLSEQRTGLPLSDEHKASISASQKRRLAAQKLMQEVQEQHRHQRANGYIPHSSPLNQAGKQGKRMTKSQVLQAFREELQEFKALRAELAPWVDAFQAQHDRKPRLADAERTGIEWLINKFKQYLVVRERVLTDTPLLRSKLDEALPDPLNITAGPQKASTAAMSSAAARFASALQYRQKQHEKQEQLQVDMLSSKNESDQTPSTGKEERHASRDSSLHLNNGAQHETKGDKAASSGSGSADSSSSQVADGKPNEQDSTQPPVTKQVRIPAPNAPPRVRSAMLAALEYKKKKSEKH